MTSRLLRITWLLTFVCTAVMSSGCANSRFNAPFGFSRSTNSEREELFDLARRELKSPAKTYLRQAQVQELSGQHEPARKSYNFVLQEEPNSVGAILGLARLDQLAGRTTEAERGVRRAVELKPRDSQVLDAAGQYFASRKNWDEAIKLLDAATMAAPNDPVPRQHLAIVLAQSGNVDAALPHFRRTVGEAQAHYNVGFILFEQGHLQAAHEQFLRALSHKPDLSEAHAMLEQIQEKRGVVLTSGQTGAAFGHTAYPPQNSADNVRQNETRGPVNSVFSPQLPSWPMRR